MLIVGYAFGNAVPLMNLLAPEKNVIFESNYTIRSGTIGKTRYFGSSIAPLPIEILFGDQPEFPKLKPAPND